MPHLPSFPTVRRSLVIAFCYGASVFTCFAQGPQHSPNIFATVSTPGHEINSLAYFVLMITGSIFLTVTTLLAFVIFKYKERRDESPHEPPQIYGSVQVELAWTAIPIIIVLVLFLTTARIIFAVQNAPEPKSALDVDVIGHQFWWEFRYPQLGIVTANELHIPVSNKRDTRPTFLRLLSADVDHSFWVPQLDGKTDLIPNHPNQMWMDPSVPGVYVGQCAQFCGIEHAKMLIRVYVDSPRQFDAWVSDQKKAAVQNASVAEGRRVFETEACTNCHTINGTSAKGTVGPDLTHLMSRDTIAAGVVPNTPGNLRKWIQNPGNFKDGALMPAMQLDKHQLDDVVAYLSTLH